MYAVKSCNVEVWKETQNPGQAWCLSCTMKAKSGVDKGGQIEGRRLGSRLDCRLQWQWKVMAGGRWRTEVEWCRGHLERCVEVESARSAESPASYFYAAERNAEVERNRAAAAEREWERKGTGDPRLGDYR